MVRLDGSPWLSSLCCGGAPIEEERGRGLGKIVAGDL